MRPGVKQQIEEAAKDLGLRLLYTEELEPGDLYLAARNTGPHLLTVREVDKVNGIVHPKEFPAYSFNLGECVKVVEND
jgi:hypothetical protein